MHAGDLYEGLPGQVVYAGSSLGSVAAQALCQKRSGARGALLYHGGAAPRWFPEPASGHYDPQATGLLLTRSLASLSAL